MANTDRELKDATQVVYLKLLEKAYKNLQADGEKGPFSVRDLIYSSISEDLKKNNPNLDLKDLVKISDLDDADKEIIEKFTDNVFDWKIADVHDTTKENGFFGCVIETAEKEAVVAFRGSEGLKTYRGLIHDWAEADLGLLNTKETKQHKEAEKYADELIEKGLIDKYDSIDVTGHSLGGNLASHFGIICEKKKRKALFNKIDRVVNFDGPGFSDEYLKYFSEQIKKGASKITHFKWSLVGSLLHGIPGEKGEYLRIKEPEEGMSFLDRIKYLSYYRHHTKSIEFDEAGNAKRGKQDIVSKSFEILSKAADKIPEYITYRLASDAAFLADKFLYEKEDGSIGFKFPFSNKGKYPVRANNEKYAKLGEEFMDALNLGVLSNECIDRRNDTGIGKNGFEDFIEAAIVDKSYNRNILERIKGIFKNDKNNYRDIEPGISLT